MILGRAADGAQHLACPLGVALHTDVVAYDILDGPDRRSK
jgi:hypothetical protein